MGAYVEGARYGEEEWTYITCVEGVEEIWVTWIAKGGGDVKRWCYIFASIEEVVGVNALG